MQVALSAHRRPKAIPANSAIQIRVVAPWYVATNDGRAPILNQSQMCSRDAEVMT